ncbi:unnamed protein product [Cuscuta epithymum]|uniref:Formin-like protein n=1 Tax=Cuscuta epithymum TaxID=186058 RepID=A0AAV0F1P3_9ASTE|nr:unnamed protein product [Cuscuta epithymum]
MHSSSVLVLFIFILSYSHRPASSSAAAAGSASNRRVLHQPLFPVDSPPAPSPPSTSTPDFPFTSTAPQSAPFFPPSPPAFASSPANSTLPSIPRSPKSTSPSLKLIATIAACVAAVAAVIALSVAGFLHFRKRRRPYSPSDHKTRRSGFSNRLNRGNNPGSGQGANSPAIRPTLSSTEFLYLGTVVNSNGGIESQARQNHPINIAGGAATPRKVDSPELMPLTRLCGQGSRQNYSIAGRTSVADGGENDKCYTPTVGSSMTIGSASRSALTPIEPENGSGGSTSSSSSDSSSSLGSGSGSARRSVSLSISPPPSLSPKDSIPKSPELVAVQIIPPVPAPPFPSHFQTQLADARNSQSPSPASSSSSGRDESPRISGIWDKKLPSPAKTSSPSLDSPVRLGNSSVESPVSFKTPSASPLAAPHVPAPPPPVPAPPSSVPPPPSSVPAPPLRVKRIENLIAPVPQSQRIISELTPLMPTTTKSGEVSPSKNVQKNEVVTKPKLKPLHWDKVRASSDHETVWDHLQSSSFKVNEEMIESLFVVNAPNSKANGKSQRSVIPSSSQEHRVLDPKRSQNIAISLRALNATVEEVCEALLEGNVDTLGTELLESLLKMAPSKEEERKLREYREDDDSPTKLGPAEKFLKAVLGVPFAFKRVDAMLYISNFESEVDYLKKSFKTLEAACEELRSSRMFLKLLEAVLKTGNRMNVGTNRGEAHAFKLDTLLKLVHVKSADGKTTLLHFVVQEIIRSEGAKLSSANKDETASAVDHHDAKFRKLGLQVISRISSELTNVKKAASIDSEILHGDVLKLSKGILKIAEVIRLNEADMDMKFSESMKRFTNVAEEEVIRLQAQESVALSLVKEITEYFHGDSAKEEAHPFRIFMVVRDFLVTLDRVCKEVGVINEQSVIISSANKFPVPVNPMLQPVISGFIGRGQSSSSGDK